MRNDPMENRKPSFFKRFLLVLLVTLLLAGAAGYGALYVLLKGPSPYAGGLFVAAVEDAVLGDAVLHLFLTDEEIGKRRQAAEADGSGETEVMFSVYPRWNEE